jgi:hypothetical protein
VSEDQLEQSREKAASEGREQAMRVSFWEEGRGPFGTDWSIHIMNRSPDPVSGVTLAIIADDDKVPGVLRLFSIGPCSETIYGSKDLYRLANLEGLSDRLSMKFLRFTDRDGVAWQRTGARLTPTTAKPQLPTSSYYQFLPQKAPVVKKLTVCDGS